MMNAENDAKTSVTGDDEGVRSYFKSFRKKDNLIMKFICHSGSAEIYSLNMLLLPGIGIPENQ